MTKLYNISKSIVWPNSEIIEDLANLRKVAPLTHCITNVVVTNYTANVLLAVGASPAMIYAIEEVSDFVKVAQSLLINVGTINTYDAESMLSAAKTAYVTKTPWVLDPVAVGALKFRRNIVSLLVNYKPSIIRGNASEILALAGTISNSKGVDSTMSSIDAIDAARSIAKKTNAVVAISGEVDYITDGEIVISVPGGHEIMTKVTGSGCSLGALMASLLAVVDSPIRAATTASAIFAICGERAIKKAKGPGSFATAFIDELYCL